MKKIITILAIIVLSMSVFVACGDNYRTGTLTGEKQKTSYAVTSNGGSAVQYGNYVYFVNGNRGFDDADGKQNVFGEVKKGGMFRAELNGTEIDRVEIVDGKETVIKDKSGNTVKDFKSVANADTFIEFKSTKGKDYDDKDIDIVNVQSFVPKTIGTSGYDKGGIFIFDNYVYYASPNNEKNKEGVTSATLVDFYRTKIDGTGTQRIYTTTVDGTASAYSFFNQGGKVYLVVYNDNKIFSIPMTANKVESDKMVYIEGVTSVIFPEKSTYYKDIATNGIEDYIYFTRAPKENEQRLGNIVEMVRPSLQDSEKILEAGKTITLDAVRDGLLFYRHAGGSTAVNIYYDNLYTILKEKDSTFSAQKGGFSDRLGFPVGTYTSIYSFRPTYTSNIVYQLVTTASSAVLFENNANPITIFEGKMDVKLVQDDYVYFTSDEAKLYRTKLFETYASKSADAKKQQLTKEDVLATSGFRLDFVAGHAVYMSKVDEWASNYTFFKKAGTPYKDAIEIFVGERTKADTKPVVCDVDGCEEEYHDHTERDADKAAE